MAHSNCGWTCGCAGKTVRSLENTCHSEYFWVDDSRSGAVSSVCSFYTNWLTDWLAVQQTDRLTDWQTDRQTDRHTQTHRQTDTDRQTDRRSVLSVLCETVLCIIRTVGHSLANNKTVVQLRWKSTTRNGFLLEYVRDFCSCPFMLNISLFLLIDFAGSDTGTSLLYW